MSNSAPAGTLPAISVVIPTRDRSAEVCRAISSVLQSERTDIEVVIVDDGSSDDTLARICEFSDVRLRWKSLDSGGNANRARNIGARLARSPLIAFLDSDDMFLPGRLDRLIGFFDGAPEIDCLIDGYIEYSRGRTFVHRMPGVALDPAALRYALLAHVIPLTNSALTIRRSAFEALDGYDEAMPRHQDRELLLRMAAGHAVALGQATDVEKHRSANSISHEFDGYIEGLNALAARVPDFSLAQNQSLFSYLIVRGILKAMTTGHWRAAAREIARLRRAERLPKGFLRNLNGYSAGRRLRHLHRARMNALPRSDEGDGPAEGNVTSRPATLSAGSSTPPR